MPRLARLDARPPYSAWLEGEPDPRDGGQAPGVLHHIMVRGMERPSILKENKDCDSVLERERAPYPAARCAA
ncbi:MAG TPA: hypothetical protein VMW89_07795 [Desulfatiglandales bacterium]|nr:hypothetical protein [Desulfatiglandales bacterium]